MPLLWHLQSARNGTFWVDVSRLCGLILLNLLTITHHVPFISDTMFKYQKINNKFEIFKKNVFLFNNTVLCVQNKIKYNMCNKPSTNGCSPRRHITSFIALPNLIERSDVTKTLKRTRVSTGQSVMFHVISRKHCPLYNSRF